MASKTNWALVDVLIFVIVSGCTRFPPAKRVTTFVTEIVIVVGYFVTVAANPFIF